MVSSTHSRLTAGEVLDREFLEIRAKVLELAAAFDRIERAPERLSQDPRLDQLAAALEIVATPDREDRAEQVQLVFSRPYDADWQATLRIARRS